ncbi:MAG TPA: hypothetical protein ENL03_05885 [Phycisphaerae bacterium]|nr:hypothetical protein [Phycisphaerae bacterium]
MNDQHVYLNGQLVPASSASVSVFDVGLLHGASVFTTMLAHNGKVFRLDQHIARLKTTADDISMAVECDHDHLVDAVGGVLQANSLTSARVRITLTPGAVRSRGSTVLVTADELPEYPDEPLDVIVTGMKQPAGDLTAGRKTGCYLPRIAAMQEASQHGAHEALWFTHDQRLAEACFSNVFLVTNGELTTPDLLTPVLPGIIRQVAIDLAGKLGIPCSEKSLSIDDMLAGDEVFLTSSCAGIRPIGKIEQHIVGERNCGPVTQQIMAAYRELLETECPKAP